MKATRSNPKLPQATESEQMVLGGMFLSAATVELVTSKLTPAEFADQKHRVIAHAVWDLHEKGQPVTVATVTEHLARQEWSGHDSQLTFVGGKDALNTLQAFAPDTPDAVAPYVERVLEAAALRQVHGKLTTWQTILPESSLPDLLTTMERDLEALRQRGNGSYRPETISADELLRLRLPDPRWAVPKLIPQGLNLLVSKPKIGKSWLAYQLGIAIATGGMALSSIEVEQGEALLLMLEDTKRRSQKRIAQLLQGDTAPARLHIATEWKRMDAGGRQDLEAWLKKHSACRIVVIDTLEKFRTTRNDKKNAYADDYSALAEIKALADRHEIAVIVIHHERKAQGPDIMDAVSGSMGVTGAADGLLLIRRERGRSEAILHVTGRDVEEAEYLLTFDKITAWNMLGDAETASRTREEEQVIELVRELDQIKAADLVDRFGIKASTARARLFRLAEKGILSTRERGLYSLSSRYLENRANPLTSETPATSNNATSKDNVTHVSQVADVSDVRDVATNPPFSEADIPPDCGSQPPLLDPDDPFIDDDEPVPTRPELASEGIDLKEFDLRDRVFQGAYRLGWPEDVDLGNEVEGAEHYLTGDTEEWWREFCQNGPIYYLKQAQRRLRELESEGSQ